MPTVALSNQVQSPQRRQSHDSAHGRAKPPLSPVRHLRHGRRHSAPIDSGHRGGAVRVTL